MNILNLYIKSIYKFNNNISTYSFSVDPKTGNVIFSGIDNSPSIVPSPSRVPSQIHPNLDPNLDKNSFEIGNCTICMKENKVIHILQHINSISNNLSHKICIECYKSLENKDICPFCKEHLSKEYLSNDILKVLSSMSLLNNK